MIEGLQQMPDAVTVLVSTELLAQLEADWSDPVQIQIKRTPGIGSGYEMIARTHTCQPGPVCKRCLGLGTVDAVSPKPCPDCAAVPGTCDHGVPAGDVCKVCG